MGVGKKGGLEKSEWKLTEPVMASRVSISFFSYLLLSHTCSIQQTTQKQAIKTKQSKMKWKERSHLSHIQHTQISKLMCELSAKNKNRNQHSNSHHTHIDAAANSKARGKKKVSSKFERERGKEKQTNKKRRPRIIFNFLKFIVWLKLQKFKVRLEVWVKGREKKRGKFSGQKRVRS